MLDYYQPKQARIRAWQVPLSGIRDAVMPTWLAAVEDDLRRQVRNAEIPLGHWVVAMFDGGCIYLSDVHFRSLFAPWTNAL